ncbi:hypothetical protein CHUAL_000362 [Chamberlinius hualienensis]
MDHLDSDLREQIFHNVVREYIIFMLLFILLCILSYIVISKFKRQEREEYYPADDEDAKVYRIYLWICTFSFAVSVGAVFLLPFSIMSNEILLLYPNSYYVKWINSSLIQGLWNLVFLFSNLCLFVLLPFAYLFSESEGFPGSTKGLKARAYETLVMLILVSLLVLGMTYILSALIDQDKSSIESLFICTPLGFVRLFTVVGNLIVKPKFLGNFEEEYFIACSEETSLQRKIASFQSSGISYHLLNGVQSLQARLVDIQEEKIKLERRRKASSIQRNVVYPSVKVLLVVITGISVLIVAVNTLELLFGFKALPVTSQQFALGITSHSTLGLVGAAFQAIIIWYLMLTSVAGFYTIPVFTKFRPKWKSTPMTHVLFNCAVLLILSSALPLLSRILGITNFDLLGDFGKIEWLGNIYIILFYNVVFAVAVTIVLVSKFAATMRRVYSILSLISSRRSLTTSTKMYQHTQ